MSAWRSLLRIFWALKWPLLGELLMVVFWMDGCRGERHRAHRARDIRPAHGRGQRDLRDMGAVRDSRRARRVDLHAIHRRRRAHELSFFNVAAMLQRNAFSYLMGPARAPLSQALRGEAVSRFRDDTVVIGQYMTQFKFFVSHMFFLPVALFIMARIDALMTFGVFVPIFIVVIVVNMVRGRVQRYRKERPRGGRGRDGLHWRDVRRRRRP